jgi:hypothetical protein
MLEDFSQQQPTVVWNSVRGVWETNQVNLLCGHLEPFLGTWQTSGMMRNGQVFGLPMPEHHIVVSESLSLPSLPNDDGLLRTPSAIEGQGGAISEKKAREKNRMLQVRDQMAQLAYENGLKVSDAIAVDLLPTPIVRDYKDGAAPQTRNGKVSVDTVGRAVMNSGEVSEFSWGKFEAAIRRWETVTGRKAPAPTKPDGKDGSHRLSSAFTEWMMGLPEGWITDVGLSRVDELKACGNGVVPQQAELALRILLEGVDLD